MKKFAPLLLLVALAAGRATAATAYDALQVIKKERGESVLKQLIQVRGETGQPQPQSWTILMADPAARAGIREFVVADGAIASERTPVRGYAAEGRQPALDFARLNLDSDGAFKLANQQAVQNKVGFHTVDYTLRTSDSDGAPLWVLHLFDHMGAAVGTLRVSAESGKVIQALQLDPDAREKPAAAQASDDDSDTKTHFKGGVFGFVEKTSKNVGTTVKDTSINVGRTVKKTTLHVAGAVQEALTGERTVDQEDTKESSGQQ